jgi:hypothetical protein
VFEYNVYVNRLAILEAGEIGVHEIQIELNVARALSFTVEVVVPDPHRIFDTTSGITAFLVVKDPKLPLSEAAAFS